MTHLSDEDKTFLREVFAAEAPHHIDHMDEAVARLTTVRDEEAQAVLLRAVHSLRGDAAMVGLPQLAEAMSAAEELLHAARTEHRIVGGELLEGYGDLARAFRSALPAILAGEDTINADLVAALDKITRSA